LAQFGPNVEYQAIIIDADETLWHTEQHFQAAQQHLKLLPADFAGPDHLSERVVEAEKRNICLYNALDSVIPSNLQKRRVP
jgi:FMN phosphatase YigB (HAD superfamily)